MPLWVKPKPHRPQRYWDGLHVHRCENRDEYQKCAHWLRIKSLYANSGRPQRCMLCALRGLYKLHQCLHHRRYNRVGSESLNDLIPLCHRCHFLLHKAEVEQSIPLSSEVDLYHWISYVPKQDIREMMACFLEPEIDLIRTWSGIYAPDGRGMGLVIQDRDTGRNQDQFARRIRENWAKHEPFRIHPRHFHFQVLSRLVGYDYTLASAQSGRDIYQEKVQWEWKVDPEDFCSQEFREEIQALIQKAITPVEHGNVRINNHPRKFQRHSRRH